MNLWSLGGWFILDQPGCSFLFKETGCASKALHVYLKSFFFENKTIKMFLGTCRWSLVWIANYPKSSTIIWPEQGYSHMIPAKFQHPIYDHGNGSVYFYWYMLRVRSNGFHIKNSSSPLRSNGYSSTATPFPRSVLYGQLLFSCLLRSITKTRVWPYQALGRVSPH